MDGQKNLMDAVRREIRMKQGEKEYKLKEKVATLMVRPRGWHLVESHLLVDGEPVSASLFDFGLFFCANARELVSRGSGPYFYLAKMESRHEAALWNEAFVIAQNYAKIPVGTIRATVLIETILAAFEMEEILWELRHHSAGLNCGRWDYIFSFIKKFYNHPSFVLPDRDLVAMTQHMMSSYVKLLIQSLISSFFYYNSYSYFFPLACHKRGVHAMGGGKCFCPI